MGTNKIRFGIIGSGGRGLSAINGIKNDPKKRGDIVALCDVNQIINEEVERKVQNAFGHGTANYTNYQDLIDNPEVDVVIIATPDQFHRDMAVAAFKAKKHVFLEKPVGRNLQEMHDIVTAAKESGKILEIGYTLRYSPFYEEIKNMIEKDILGRILSATLVEHYYGGAGVFWRGWWRFRKHNGGIMNQKISHDFDLAFWMFGRPKTISAFTSNMEFKPGNWDSDAEKCSECSNNCPYKASRSQTRFGNDQCIYNTDKTGADIADNAQAIVQFESGMIMSISMNFFSSKGQDGRFWRVIGSKGEITGSLEEQLVRFDPRHEERPILYETASASLGGHGGGDAVQLNEFLDALSEGRESRAGLESAYWSSILVMGAQISADTNQTVNVEDLTKKYPFPI